MDAWHSASGARRRDAVLDAGCVRRLEWASAAPCTYRVLRSGHRSLSGVSTWWRWVPPSLVRWRYRCHQMEDKIKATRRGWFKAKQDGKPQARLQAVPAASPGEPTSLVPQEERTKAEAQRSWLCFSPVVHWGQGQALLVSKYCQRCFLLSPCAAFASWGRTPVLSHTGLDAPAVRLVFIPLWSLGMDLFKTLEKPKFHPLTAFRAHAPLSSCPGN